MQVFPRETTDYIADQFYSYFRRKAHREKMSLKDAKALIDFVNGPSPMPYDVSSVDYERPRVSGGGGTRPPESRIISIMQKADEASVWDDVFNELIQRYQDDKETTRLIKLAFKERMSDSCICEKMNIGRTTFYEYRIAVLSKAGIIAIQNGLLSF